MKFKEYLKEAEGKTITLYHVTLTKNIPKIVKKGILTMQTTNWTTGAGKRYGEGDIYAMTKEIDAFRWAGRMDWEFHKKMGSGQISVIEFEADPTKWTVDKNDPLSQAGNKGKWLQSKYPVKPEQIKKTTPVTIDQIRQVTLHEETMLKEKFVTASKLKQTWARQEDSIAYCQIHKNPDASEVLEIIKDYKEANPEQYEKTGEMDFVRGIFDVKSDLYVWYGNFFHEPVIDEFKLKIGENNFRFGWAKRDKYLTIESGRLNTYFKSEKEYSLYTAPEDITRKNKELKRLKRAFPMVIGEDGLPKFHRQFLIATASNK